MTILREVSVGCHDLNEDAMSQRDFTPRANKNAPAISMITGAFGGSKGIRTPDPLKETYGVLARSPQTKKLGVSRQNS